MSIRPASFAAYKKSPSKVKVMAPATSQTDALRVESPNNKVAIVNKRYATKPDFVVGDIAVGIMEGIKYTKK